MHVLLEQQLGREHFARQHERQYLPASVRKAQHAQRPAFAEDRQAVRRIALPENGAARGDPLLVLRRDLLPGRQRLIQTEVDQQAAQAEPAHDAIGTTRLGRTRRRWRDHLAMTSVELSSNALRSRTVRVSFEMSMIRSSRR